MIRYRLRYSLWIKAIAIGVVCLFSINNISWAYPNANTYTLAASNRFNSITDEEIAKSFMKEVIFVQISHLLGDDLYNPTQEYLENPLPQARVDAMRAYITDHLIIEDRVNSEIHQDALLALEELRYNKAKNAYELPLQVSGEETCYYEFYLKEDHPDETPIKIFPLGGNKYVYVRVESLEIEPVAEEKKVADSSPQEAMSPERDQTEEPRETDAAGKKEDDNAARKAVDEEGVWMTIKRMFFQWGLIDMLFLPVLLIWEFQGYSLYQLGYWNFTMAFCWMVALPTVYLLAKIMADIIRPLPKDSPERIKEFLRSLRSPKTISLPQDKISLEERIDSADIPEFVQAPRQFMVSTLEKRIISTSLAISLAMQLAIISILNPALTLIIPASIAVALAAVFSYFEY